MGNFTRILTEKMTYPERASTEKIITVVFALALTYENDILLVPVKYTIVYCAPHALAVQHIILCIDF